MGKLACIFPGQGSQCVGMGLDLYDAYPEAKRTFEEIDRLSGQKLSKLCFAGPDSELKRTINTQPTILAASVAAWTCFKSQGGPKPDFVAGHSLGEITALVAADALHLEEAIVLVQERAILMEECPLGAMSAVLGLSADKLEECCKSASETLKRKLQGANSTDSCVIVANFNTRDQLVISGNPDAVLGASQLAKNIGGKVIPLPVGGAFHSPLMERAAQQFSITLDQVLIEDPSFPIVQNYNGQPSSTAKEIRDNLRQQMNNAVRWYSSIEYMLSQGVDTFVEIGPGKVLTGTVRKINAAARTFNVSDHVNLQATLEGLKHHIAI